MPNPIDHPIHTWEMRHYADTFVFFTETEQTVGKDMTVQSPGECGEKSNLKIYVNIFYKIMFGTVESCSCINCQ